MTRSTTARAGVTAALFVACTAITAAGLLDGLDHAAAAALWRREGHAGEIVLSWAVLPGSNRLTAGWLAILALVAVRRPWWRGRVLALAAVVVAGTAVELALKAVIDHPGPYPLRGVVTFGSTEFGRGSFPSGHTFRGTALAFGTALLARPSRRVAALVVAAGYSAIVAWGVLYLNWHWTSDAIGGMLLGLTASAVVAAVPILDRRMRA